MKLNGAWCGHNDIKFLLHQLEFLQNIEPSEGDETARYQAMIESLTDSEVIKGHASGIFTFAACSEYIVLIFFYTSWHLDSAEHIPAGANSEFLKNLFINKDFYTVPVKTKIEFSIFRKKVILNDVN